MRPGAARALALAPAAALVLSLASCTETDEDRREDYCAAVEEHGPELSRISDEGGPAAFLEALPVLEELGSEAPDDLRDEWKTLLDALHGLEDAVEETGVDPEDLGGRGLPDDLPREDRRRLRSQASVLAGERVVAATRGIEQHALDVCHTPLL